MNGISISNTESGYCQKGYFPDVKPDIVSDAFAQIRTLEGAEQYMSYCLEIIKETCFSNAVSMTP